MSSAIHLFWQPETPYFIAAALGLAFSLSLFRPAERRTYVNTLLLFFAGLGGQLAGVAAGAADLPGTAGVLRALFQIVASIALLRLAGFAVFRLLLPLVHLRSPRIMEDVVISAAYLVLGIAQLHAAGLELGGILATSAVLTAVLAFAMQDTLGNVLGGLALQLDNSIRVGDWVKVEDVGGRVTDIGWRSTLVETRNWETVVIPNSQLMRGKVVILGQRKGEAPRWRRWVFFSVDPSVPPARAIAIAESAVQEAEIPNVARTPPANCVLMDFEQGNLRYAVRYWLTNFAPDDVTDSAVRMHLFTALQRAGIRIAEPQQTEHSIQVNEAHAQSVRQRELQRRLRAINGVDLFASLSEEERTSLAGRLQYAPFAAGDIMTRQGNTSHWLYILTSGEAESLLELPDGAKHSLGKISAGGYFGETGMMTGAPRGNTVIARKHVECYRLDNASFRDLLLTRPEIAEDISRTMAAHAARMQAAQEAARAGGAKPESSSEILDKIRQFFGIE